MRGWSLPPKAGKFVLYDFYANPLPPESGKIVVPLNNLGYFLRTDGSRGSFAAPAEGPRQRTDRRARSGGDRGQRPDGADQRQAEAEAQGLPMC